MLHAYIVHEGRISICSVSGLTPVELKRMTDAGWVTYWSTDRAALAKGTLLAEESMRVAYAAQHGMTREQVTEFEATYGVDVIELTENRLREQREFQALSYWERVPETYQSM